MTSTNMPTLAVIGVGTTGVHALFWGKKRGFDVQGFEAENGCGGIWRCGSGHSPAYDSLFTNSSVELMMMGHEHAPAVFHSQDTFPKHGETTTYYETFMKQNHLNDCVKWNTTVTHLVKTGNKWSVTWQPTDNDAAATTTSLFDYVFVCVGKLWDPESPAWAKSITTQQQSPKLIHARYYRNPSPFTGRRVVVVGVGNTATDVALELSRNPHVQKPIYMSCRRGATILPIRGPFGLPDDALIVSRFFQYAMTKSARLGFIDSLVKEPLAEFQKYGFPAPPNPHDPFAPENPVSNCKETKLFIEQLRAGHIKFLPDITSVVEGAIVLSDGTRHECDDIILATGYKLGLDFLDTPLRAKIVKVIKQDNGRTPEILDLYKNCIFPHDNTLALLTFVTSYGNESIIGGMQARYVTKFWTDDKLLSQFNLNLHNKQMKKQEEMIRKSNIVSTVFVRYLPYMDDLASGLGVLPDIPSRLRNPLKWKIAWKLIFGPAVAAQYFLDGEDRWEGAEEFLARL